MHVLDFEIENYCRIEAMRIPADGNHVVIEGPNGEGKSSSLDAFLELMQGISKKDCPDPVHHGADKCIIRGVIGDKTVKYSIEKHIPKEGKPKLFVKCDGVKVDSPHTFLNGLLDPYAVNPVSFYNRRPQDQFDDILRVCEVNPPVEKVKELTGEDWPALPGENGDAYLARLSADEVGEYYRRRRDQHRVVETNRGAVQKQEAHCASLGADGDANARTIDVILAEMDQEQAQQNAYDSASKAKAEAQREYERLSDLWTQVDTERLTLGKQKAELEAKLKEVNDKLTVVADRLEKGMNMVSEARLENEDAQKKLNQCGDRSKTLQELRMELNQCQANQKAVIQRQHASEHLEQLRSELIASQTKHGQLDRQLEALRQLRKDLLEGLDLGVDGLVVGNGELLLHGVTFKQASRSQKMRVSLAVAMKGKGELKIIRIDDGEQLDSESKEYLLAMAKENGWQVIMTRVADLKELQVEIVEKGVYDALGEPNHQMNLLKGYRPENEAAPDKKSAPAGKKAPKGKLFETAKEAASM